MRNFVRPPLVDFSYFLPWKSRLRVEIMLMKLESLKISEPLLQIAQTWEDRAWALLIGHLDVTMEEMVRSATIGDNIDLPASYWKQKQPIENLLQKASATTDQQDSIYRKIQEFLIEDDFGNLAEYINQLECTNKHEARFIAHLAITLQQLTVTNTSNNPIRLAQYLFPLIYTDNLEFTRLLSHKWQIQILIHAAMPF